jgi:hypothetical protein
MAKRKKQAAKSITVANAGGNPAAAAATPPPPPDPFVVLSLEAWEGLNEAVRECDWIADGGDPTATEADRNEANLKQAEYDRAQIRVMQRLTSYLAKKLSVVPPSATDVAQAKALVASLAAMRDQNVKVSAVVAATTQLLAIYAKTG